MRTLLCSCAVSIVALAACSDDPATNSSSSSSASSGGSSSSSSGSSSSSSSSSSSGGSMFMSCTQAELDADDHLNTGADVSFGAPVAQYMNRCVRIKVGKDVGFYGPFTTHPLANNGEAGNPIPSVTTGMDSGRIVFNTPGTYGFHCAAHAGVMYGAVKVVP